LIRSSEADEQSFSPIGQLSRLIIALLTNYCS